MPNQTAKYFPFGNNVDPATLRPPPAVPFPGLPHPASMGVQAHMSNLNYNLKPESGHGGYWPTHSHPLSNFTQYRNHEELLKWHNTLQGPQFGGEFDGLPSMTPPFSTPIAGPGQMTAGVPLGSPMSAAFPNPEYTIPGTTGSFSSADSPDTLDSAIFTDDGRVSPYSSSSQQLMNTGYLFSPVSGPSSQQGRHPSIPAISLTMSTSPTSVNPVWRQPSPGMATSTDSLPNTATMGGLQDTSYLTIGSLGRVSTKENEPPHVIAPRPRKYMPLKTFPPPLKKAKTDLPTSDHSLQDQSTSPLETPPPKRTSELETPAPVPRPLAIPQPSPSHQQRSPRSCTNAPLRPHQYPSHCSTRSTSSPSVTPPSLHPPSLRNMSSPKKRRPRSQNASARTAISSGARTRPA